MTKKSIVLYLHVHQPWRVRDDQTLFNVGLNENYFSEKKGLKRQSNGEIFRKVAEKSYIPMNNLLEKLLKTHPKFKFSFSITGPIIIVLLSFLTVKNLRLKFAHIRPKFVKFSVLKQLLFEIQSFLIMTSLLNGQTILVLKQF